MGRLIRSSEFDGANNLVQRIEQLYDKANRLEKQSWVIEGDSYSESYTYNDPVVGADASVRPQDGSLASVTTATGDTIAYTYNSLKRLGGTTVENAAGDPLFRTGYSYKAGAETNQTTNQVLVYTTWDPNYSNILSYRYSYDALGNITKIEDVTNAARTLAEYTYDELNQLTQEKIYNYNSNGTYINTDTYVYTYDSAGNILTEKKNNTVVNAYTYSTGPWADQLVAVNGQTISYDGTGNPLNYYNGEKSYSNLTWENGRQLASITTGGKTYTYSYDADGIRTQKVVNGVTHTYVTQNGKVVRETIGTGAMAKVLDFVYDNSGKPFALTYTNGTAEPQRYYYVLNLQGDVVALMTAERTFVAQYTYNAWGKVLSVTGENGNAITSAIHIANLNPIRYRGYYYDTETGFYYLQSRYYDPANHRFLINDVLFDRGVGFVGFNLYLYCGNNPVNRKDASGFDSVKIDDGDGDILELETYGGGSGGGSGRDVGGGNYSGGTSSGAGGGSSYTTSLGGSTSYSTSSTVSGSYGSGGYDSSHYTYTTGQGYGNSVCFVANTLVKTESGDIPIQKIEVGDLVWAWDESTGDISLKHVVETYINETNKLIRLSINGEIIVTTPEHPFYLPEKGWTEAGRLRTGDILVLVNGEYAVVDEVQHELLERTISVYNFQVEDYHTYFVSSGGVLVHNSCNHNSAWNRERRSYWRSRAKTDTLGEDYGAYQATPENIGRMKKGLAPRDRDGISVHLHHTIGIANDFGAYVPMTREDHIAFHKNIGYHINHTK